MKTEETAGYHYRGHEPSCAHAYLLPSVIQILEATHINEKSKGLFEIGCGNGAFAHELQRKGIPVTGVDPSEQGIRYANLYYPDVNLKIGSAYDNLSAEYGRFPVVISLEVVEHVYYPRKFAKTLFDLLEPGGVAIVSTPYHGYLKNLALALTGKMDHHFTALWDYGHIKFWSQKTLRILLEEAGFQKIDFLRIGRIPPFAKTMIAKAIK